MRPIFLLLLACLAAVLSWPASAGSLYKCVGPEGHPSFQSAPCPPGATTAWTREVTPDPRPEPAREYSTPPPQAVEEAAASRRTPRALARARCRDAREHEAAMRRAHPTLGFAQLGALSSATTQACQPVR
jgi:hypothetical protein